MLSRYLGLRYQGKEYKAKLALPANADDLTIIYAFFPSGRYFRRILFFFSTR